MHLRTVEDYLRLPYHLVMVRDETGGVPGWVIWVDELKGCISQGDTPEEAVEMIHDAMEGWLAVSLEHGDDIPLPREEYDYTGKLMVRLPAGLHQQLAEGAEHEGVSLNAYITALLAGSVGWRKPASEAKTAATKRPRRQKASA